MEAVKSFKLAGFYSSPQVETHENWSILTLFLVALSILAI